MSAQSQADGHRTLSCSGVGGRGHLHVFPSLPPHCSPRKALLFQEVSRRTQRVPKALLKARFTQPSTHPPPHGLHLCPWKTPHGKVLVPSLQHQSKALFPYRESRLLSISPATATVRGMLQHTVPRMHPLPCCCWWGKEPGNSWLSSLPREVDGECRLWEEMTMFIVWIEYFSWPSLYCSVPFISLFFLPPPRHPEHADSPSLLPEALWHARRKSGLKNTERDREGTGLASGQEDFWDASLP